MGIMSLMSRQVTLLSSSSSLLSSSNSMPDIIDATLKCNKNGMRMGMDVDEEYDNDTIIMIMIMVCMIMMTTTTTMTSTVSSPDFLPMSVRGSDIAQTPTWNMMKKEIIKMDFKTHSGEKPTWNMVKK